MGAVCKLRLPERVLLDPDRLVELCVSMGEPAAEALVTASIGDVALGMETLTYGDLVEDKDKILKVVKRLRSIAEHIGLTTFVRVADDVETAAKNSDIAAYGATLERLKRVAAKAQTALWDLQDMMI